MKFFWIIELFIFGALVMVPFISSLASDNFYLYEDTNKDGIFDHRIHFKGELIDKLTKYETSALDNCWENVNIMILAIHCSNDPPCPYCFSCQPTGSSVLVFEWNTYPCSCLTSNKEDQGYVYISTKQQNRYRQITMTSGEFTNFLMHNFQVVEEGKEQRCDNTFGIDLIWWCDPNWYCPSYICNKNPNAYITGVIILEPVCECYSVGPCYGPVLSEWGLICLLALLIATTIYVMTRKQKMLTN